ncbi:hypothetical protein EU546_04990 [Candidatus Thorarchaeota archaeon]|nr:MAG: hypothetical protein EU546_04990 [Candidatus Thorarchaeota archaeon]
MSAARILVVVVCVIVLLPTQTTVIRTLGGNESGSLVHGSNQFQDASEDTGQMFLEDDFSSTPIGLNQSAWSISMLNDPQLSWIDGDRIGLICTPFTRLTLTSKIETEPSMLAEFNLSFTGGRSYFGVGWSDSLPSNSSPWISNLRFSQNGVFIDFWDGQVYLVTYVNGSRTATPVEVTELDTVQNYCLLWTSSLVTLVVDGVPAGSISTQIPLSPLPFVLTISGHNYRVDSDLLAVDYVSLSTMPESPDDEIPTIDLLWPEDGSEVSQGELIDFEVSGPVESVYWMWDSDSQYTLECPWDIPTFGMIGRHSLTVFLVCENGTQIQEEFSFSIVPVSEELHAWYIDFSPQVDGMLDSDESRLTCMNHLTAWGEDREGINLDAHLGMSSSGFYLSLYSPVADSWNTRISLLFDGNDNGAWDHDGTDDISVTVAGPSAYQDYSCIRAASGCILERGNYPGLVFASGVYEDGICAEFFVPISENRTEVCFGLMIIQGGYAMSYPFRSNAEYAPRLSRVQTSNAPSPLPYALGTVGTLVALCAAIIGVTSVVGRGRMSPRYQLDDEELERLRTLLLSYPGITEERIRQMMSIDCETLHEKIEFLVSHNHIEPRLLNGVREK